MINKTCFTDDVVGTDRFYSMHLSEQALYFHLCMAADNNGCVRNPKAILRMLDANGEYLETLCKKNYVYWEDDDVVYGNKNIKIVDYEGMGNCR